MNRFKILILSFYLPITLCGMDYAISRYKTDQNSFQKQSYQIFALQNNSKNNSNVLGYISYKLDNQNHAGYIDKLFVEKSYRNQGIGTQLLFELCKHLKQEGCNKVSGVPYPIVNNIPSLLENTDLQAIALLQSLRMFVNLYPHYLPNQLDRTWLDLSLNIVALYMTWKFHRSRVDFYKKFGAQQSPFSTIAIYDLTQDTISTLEQKLQEKKMKISPANL